MLDWIADRLLGITTIAMMLFLTAIFVYGIWRINAEHERTITDCMRLFDHSRAQCEWIVQHGVMMR